MEELFRSYAANEALHQLELQLEQMRNKPTSETFEEVFRAAKRLANALDDDDEDRLTEKQWAKAQALVDGVPYERYEEDDDGY